MAPGERDALVADVELVDTQEDPLVRALSAVVEDALDDGHVEADGRGERDPIGDAVSRTLRLRHAVELDDAVATPTVAEESADVDAVRVATDDVL